MAKKNDVRLNLDVNSVPEQPKEEPGKKKANGKNNGKNQKKQKDKKPKRLAGAFKGMISELKKVEWPSFKNTKNQSGVITQTCTVLVVVLFFLVFIAAFDSGLLALLRLLVAK